MSPLKHSTNIQGLSLFNLMKNNKSILFLKAKQKRQTKKTAHKKHQLFRITAFCYCCMCKALALCAYFNCAL